MFFFSLGSQKNEWCLRKRVLWERSWCENCSFHVLRFQLRRHEMSECPSQTKKNVRLVWSPMLPCVCMTLWVFLDEQSPASDAHLNFTVSFKDKKRKKFPCCSWMGWLLILVRSQQPFEQLNLSHLVRAEGHPDILVCPWFRWERRQVIQIFRVNDYIWVLPAPSWLVPLAGNIAACQCASLQGRIEFVLGSNQTASSEKVATDDHNHGWEGWHQQSAAKKICNMILKQSCLSFWLGYLAGL